MADREVLAVDPPAATEPAAPAASEVPALKHQNRSEQINDLATSLAKSQGEISNASKDSTNPFFNSKYASLAAVWDACREPLSKNGLAVLQLPETDFTGEPVFEKTTTRNNDTRWTVRVITLVKVRTWLVHNTGQWVESCLETYVPSGDPQSIGSAIKYLRRYALEAIAGIATANDPDDDDGERVAGRRDDRVEGTTRAVADAGETQAEKIARVKREAGKAPSKPQPAEPNKPPTATIATTATVSEPAAVPAPTPPGPAGADHPAEQPGVAAGPIEPVSRQMLEAVIVTGINVQNGPMKMVDGKAAPAWGPLYVVTFSGKVIASDGASVNFAVTLDPAVAAAAEAFRTRAALPRVIPGKRKGNYALDGFDLPLEKEK
jgi:hypothetical protein